MEEGSGRGSGRVRFFSAIVGWVGSGQRFAVSGPRKVTRGQLCAELSTGRMDRGSSRVTILPDFGWSGRVGSALRIFLVLLIISWYLNRYEFRILHSD